MKKCLWSSLAPLSLGTADVTRVSVTALCPHTRPLVSRPLALASESSPSLGRRAWAANVPGGQCAFPALQICLRYFREQHLCSGRGGLCFPVCCLSALLLGSLPLCSNREGFNLVALWLKKMNESPPALARVVLHRLCLVRADSDLLPDCRAQSDSCTIQTCSLRSRPPPSCVCVGRRRARAAQTVLTFIPKILAFL